jgi:hypothetical protein
MHCSRYHDETAATDLRTKVPQSWGRRLVEVGVEMYEGESSGGESLRYAIGGIADMTQDVAVAPIDAAGDRIDAST